MATVHTLHTTDATETPDLDAVALDLRLVASLLKEGADVSHLDLPTILSDLADACDSWHECVSD